MSKQIGLLEAEETKRRIAKKYLHRWVNDWMLDASDLAQVGVGQYINDCSSFNDKIAELRPVYRRVGKGRGAVLLDVDITTQVHGSCSLRDCGIEMVSPEEVQKRIVSHLKEWVLGDAGKHWFGAEWEKEAERARRLIQRVEDGLPIVNVHGGRLPEEEIR